jgi:hypothetical protein
MKLLGTLAVSGCIVALAVVVGSTSAPPVPPAVNGPAQGQAPAPPPPQAGHGSGQLVIWGDTALFSTPDDPNNCILLNRFRRGQRIGFRMAAFDGGTGEVENSATLVAHVTFAGKTIDVPMRWRGAAGPNAPTPRGYIRAPVNLWTGAWAVPADAPTGMISYTVTATDRFGRKATFSPFTAEASQLVIVP